MRIIDRVMFVAALSGLAIPAQAQFPGGMNWVINRTRVPAIIQCPGCADANAEDATPDTAPPRSHTTRPSPQADASSLIYRPSLAMRQRNVAEFLRQSSVEAATEGDMIEQVDARMRGVGLSANNIADAYTIWLIGSWEAVHDRDLGGDRDIYQSVSRQVKRSMLTSPAVAALDNGAKQTMAEALLLQMVLTSSLLDASAGNAGERRQVGDAVAQGGAQMGVDLRAMTLSEAGIGYRGKPAR